MSIAEQALWDKKGGVTMNQKSMLTAQDLAERFGVSIYTIYRLTTKPNGLPGYRVGGAFVSKRTKWRGIWRLKRSSRLSARKSFRSEGFSTSRV